MACSAQPASGGKPLVLATTTLFADMAANVAGDRVTVESIVPAGSHVEEYEPKPEDSKKVAQASLFFVNGLDLDTWAAPLLRDKNKDAPVITLTDGLPAIQENPHMWFDVQLARRYVEKMRDALIALDAAGREAYTRNAARYDAQLVQLDTEVKAQIATIPQARRKLVTSHDAFPYYARAYGLEVVGFAQIEAGKDPTPSELAELVRICRAASVPAIFSEVGVSPAVAQTLAREAGIAKVVTDLPTDSVVEKPADTYIGVVRAVTEKIVGALR
ncbi:MAG TPA: metal ABC transporter substrate-binding protein [Candidatus Limnocylindria bacterium]|nr:metal ABC transporter substrate-binding protein [Candidatus Limnocylindria bacterium]